MNRRFFIRLCLSLLLLLSQQMAIAHAMTHWAGSRDGAAQLQQSGDGQDRRGVGAAFAQHQTCEHCLAFAQIASAVGSSPRCFSFDCAASCATGPSATEPGCARTTCAFQPRAPPSFA